MGRIIGIEADLVVEEETEGSAEDLEPEAAADLVTTEDSAGVLPTAQCPESVRTPETEEARRTEETTEEKEKRRKLTAGAEVDHKYSLGVKQTRINEQGFQKSVFCK